MRLTHPRLAFKLAGSIGVKEAVRKANPVILEPVMKVDLNVPPDCLGSVIGDITARRGRIAEHRRQERIEVYLSPSSPG